MEYSVSNIMSRRLQNDIKELMLLHNKAVFPQLKGSALLFFHIFLIFSESFQEIYLCFQTRIETRAYLCKGKNLCI